MKCFLVLSFSILFSISLKAQNKDNGQITGKVVDSISKIPVDYATVSLFKAGDINPFNGATTDPKGNFVIDQLPVGEYNIVVDFIGYQRKTITHIHIVSDAPRVSLGNILFSPVAKQLQGVTITGDKSTIENKIDRIVYNTGNDLTSQGGVALDVLKKVPQVSVDVDGNVEVQGDANILFLINGKPSSIFGASLADALQSIPASQIKSIEVLTSPGAKYDASGTGGIINIILKESKVEGINGTINLSAGTRTENGSFNLNAHKGNFGASAFFSGNEQLNSTTINTVNRTSANSTNDTFSHLTQNGNNAFKRTGYQSGASIDWNISPKDELTATFGYNHFGNNSNIQTSQLQATTDGAGGAFPNISSINNSGSRFSANTTDFSLAYKKTFKTKGQELDILSTSTFGNNKTDFSQQQDYLTAGYPPSGLISDNPGTDKETDISVDYTQPVSKNFTLETGAKAVIEDISNSIVTDTLLENGSYILNSNQTDGYTYNRNIFAYYLASTFSLFNNFIDGKAGLRYEYTSTTADFPNTYIPGYGILAPSFVLQHKLSKDQSLKFSFSYRIQRANYGDLNPFYNITDPHNISTGNPTLKPEQGHNYEFGYNRTFAKGASIFVAAIYRHNVNDIQSYTTYYSQLNIDGVTYSDVSLTQRANVGSEVTAGSNIYISIPVTGKFSLRSNMLYADRITDNPGFPQTQGFMCRVNLNASYDFGHDFAAEVFGNYRSSLRTFQGYSPSFSFYNIAVRKQLFNKKASIGLTATDPFNKYVVQTATTSGSNFNQTYTRQVPYRSFGISMSYKFGKLEFKKDKEKQYDNAPVPVEN